MASIFQKISLRLSVFLSILIAIMLLSCKDDMYSTNSKDILSFSADTVSFDTVFTSLGSTTSRIMIYNRNNTALKISHIEVAGGKNSAFRINVDGALNANNHFEDIEIRAKDSMYVFVAVTVNPTDSNSPVFIHDSLIFQTNGVTQKVKLQAYGQNIKILRNLHIANDSTLTSEKPFLVYGNLTVDSAKTLTLNSGCKIYFHNNANMKIYGNLIAQGTAEQPIALRGDRLDNINFNVPVPYNNVAGQWGGIYLLGGGKYVLNYVNMNSGYVGIHFLNKYLSNLPSLEIHNCKIQNFLADGLFVQNGDVTVTNTEISNAGSHAVYLNGGKHTFIHCTIANYFNSSSVQPVSRDKNPAVLISGINDMAPMQSFFQNCIISGDADNEFTLAVPSVSDYTGLFAGCYIQAKDSLSSKQVSHIRWSKKDDVIFKSTRYNYIKNTNFDFRPDSISVARKIGTSIDPEIVATYRLDIDLNGNIRPAQTPDAGAYQWKSIK